MFKLSDITFLLIGGKYNTKFDAKHQYHQRAPARFRPVASVNSLVVAIVHGFHIATDISIFAFALRGCDRETVNGRVSRCIFPPLLILLSSRSGVLSVGRIVTHIMREYQPGLSLVSVILNLGIPNREETLTV